METKRQFVRDELATILILLVSITVLNVQKFGISDLVLKYFSTHGKWDFGILTHIFGHKGYDHYFKNIVFIAMLGPSIERTYGSALTIIYTLLTSIIVGIVSIFLNNSICGLSSIVYMWVLLNVFNPHEKNKGVSVPAIVLIILFVLPEVVDFIKGVDDGIGHIYHFVGACCGLFFGILSEVLSRTLKKVA